METGTLTHVSLAFSRDQQEKVYVQHKMLKQGAELFQWIDQGGYIYVCGAKDPMSVDVEKTLSLIIKQHGGKDSKGAEAYLDMLKEEGRYLKDVY